MREPIQVHVPVEQDESGYPPVKEESIWCVPQKGGTYLVDNIPFYARDISLGDEIRTGNRNGQPWFEEVVRPSKNTTVRVFARQKSRAPLIVPQMQSFGGHTEKMEGSGLIAVSFPP